MIKVEEKQYRIRETTSTNGAKSYRPEKSIDGKDWIPTHSFAFTGQPFYANSYREALKCIKQDEEGKNEIIHSNPLEKVEEENIKLKEEVKDLVERNIELDKKYMFVLKEIEKLKFELELKNLALKQVQEGSILI